MEDKLKLCSKFLFFWGEDKQKHLFSNLVVNKSFLLTCLFQLQQSALKQPHIASFDYKSQNPLKYLWENVELKSD